MRFVAWHKHEEFVSLTDEEFQQAWEHGVAMRMESLRQGLRERLCHPRLTGEQVQCIGSVGERVVAKCLRIEWTKWINTFHGADLPYDIQVRLQGHDHYGVRVYQKDAGHHRVVGVVGQEDRLLRNDGSFRIPGWITASSARGGAGVVIDPNNQGRPFWCVPQQLLRTMDELRLLIHGGSKYEIKLFNCLRIKDNSRSYG